MARFRAALAVAEGPVAISVAQASDIQFTAARSMQVRAVHCAAPGMNHQEDHVLRRASRALSHAAAHDMLAQCLMSMDMEPAARDSAPAGAADGGGGEEALWQAALNHASKSTSTRPDVRARPRLKMG